MVFLRLPSELRVGRHGIAVAAIKVERLEAQAQEESISPVFGTRDVAVHRSVVRRHDGASVFDWISKPDRYGITDHCFFSVERSLETGLQGNSSGNSISPFGLTEGVARVFRGGQIRITERENGCPTRLPALAK